MYYKSVCAFVYRALNFIKRILHGSSNSTSVRKSLYLSLVRSKLSYCSQLWRPYLIKDIVSLENIQRRASKFIANDYSISYRNRLLTLQMLPLMYWLELHDLIFMVKMFTIALSIQSNIKLCIICNIWNKTIHKTPLSN